MEVFFCLLLLGSSAAGFVQGDGGEQDNRLYKKLEKFSDQLEDFNHLVSIKKVSLAKHAASLRVVAAEMDKVHQEVTKGQVVGAGVAVGGGLVSATGLALEVFKEASPLTSLAGEAISLIGSYCQSTASSKEQEKETKTVIRANNILDSCERDLKEISDTYLITQAIFKFLEEEEEHHGTIFQKKLLEIKTRFPHFLPPKIKSNHMNFNAKLVSFAVTLAKKYELIKSTKDKLFGSTKEMPNPASRPIKGEDFKEGKAQSTKGGDFKEKTAESTKGEDFKEGTVQSTKVSRTTRVLQAAQAAHTAAFVYQNSKELYNGITHLNEGARSELAENMRDVASNIEEVIRSLNQVLSN
ncbi:uncharacterized protein LOC144828267 [Lissotriton helveticus]